MLDTERQYYADHLNELLEQYRDRFVVIKDKSVVGAFDTMDEALREGARRFGVASFLARRVEETSPEFSFPSEFAGVPITVECERSMSAKLTKFGLLLIIGRDVLQHCVLVYNGIAGTITLSA